MRPAADTPNVSYDVIGGGGGTRDALARGGASAASPADRPHLNRALVKQTTASQPRGRSANERG
jgi:hypothetical protein